MIGGCGRCAGLGPRPHRIEIHELAVERRLFLGPQRLHGQHVLAHHLEARLVAHAVILHLVGVPAGADAEDEAAARKLVERGDGLGRDDRIVLRHQADAGAEQKLLGRRRREGQSHERIVGMRIALGQLAAAGERRAPAERDVGVLGHEQRIETAILERTRQFGEVDAVVGRKIENTYAHRVSPLHLLLEPDDIGYLNVTPPRSQRTHRRAWP